MTSTDVMELDSCRLCGDKFFTENLTLKSTGLANELYSTEIEAKASDNFPLVLVMCKTCKHVQLKHIVNSKRLFNGYLYQTGASISFRKHFEALANKISEIVPNRSNILEIGSNDGTLLVALKERGFLVSGVEPAVKLNENVKLSGINVISGYIEENQTMTQLSKQGPFDLIVGNNVFAHIPRMRNAFANVSSLLKENGYFIFEVAHLLKLIQNNLFDTIYHEHMSYHTLISLAPFLESYRFQIVEVEEIATHGGSLRLICKKTSNRTDVPEKNAIMREEIENEINTPLIFIKLQQQINNLKYKVSEIFRELPLDTVLIGYGAPAKIVTFLSEFDLATKPFRFIVDDNELKQGKYLPGSGIRISSVEALVNESMTQREVILVIFAWNLREEIIAKLRKISVEKLHVISFLPSPKIEVFT